MATQLALDRPEIVHTLILLELSLFSVPSSEAFLEQAGQAVETYRSGDHAGALAMFMTAVIGLDWTACRTLLEERVPGAVAQAVEDADTFFGVELPALSEWEFGPEQAAAIDGPSCPCSAARPGLCGWTFADFLRSSLPRVEERTIAGAGHLLHIQRRPRLVAAAVTVAAVTAAIAAGGRGPPGAAPM